MKQGLMKKFAITFAALALYAGISIATPMRKAEAYTITDYYDFLMHPATLFFNPSEPDNEIYSGNLLQGKRSTNQHYLHETFNQEYVNDLITRYIHLPIKNKSKEKSYESDVIVMDDLFSPYMDYMKIF